MMYNSKLSVHAECFIPSAVRTTARCTTSPMMGPAPQSSYVKDNPLQSYPILKNSTVDNSNPAKLKKKSFNCEKQLCEDFSLLNVQANEKSELNLKPIKRSHQFERTNDTASQQSLDLNSTNLPPNSTTVERKSQKRKKKKSNVIKDCNQFNAVADNLLDSNVNKNFTTEVRSYSDVLKSSNVIHRNPATSITEKSSLSSNVGRNTLSSVKYTHKKASDIEKTDLQPQHSQHSSKNSKTSSASSGPAKIKNKNTLNKICKQDAVMNNESYSKNHKSLNDLSKIGKSRFISKPTEETKNLSVEEKQTVTGKSPKVKHKVLSNQPIIMDLSKILELSHRRSVTASLPKKNTSVKVPKKGPNLLDSSSVIKRGKEKEFPKRKKNTTLRKIIIKDRMLKRSQFLQDLGLLKTRSLERLHEQLDLPLEMDDDTKKVIFPTSNFSSSQLRNFHPLVRQTLHSSKFREYCNQIVSPEMNSCCIDLLKDLVKYQDQQHHKDPFKAVLKRRLVFGLKEVIKYLKINKIKCAIISPNLEKGSSEGGLDDKIEQIITLCRENQVPFIFAMNRKQLGKTCLKKVPVSVVGVLNYEGAESHFSKLKLLAEEAHRKYEDMKMSLNEEIESSETCKTMVNNTEEDEHDRDSSDEINL